MLGRSFLPVDLMSGQNVIDGLVVVQADCRDDQALAEAAWFQQLRDDGIPVIAAVAQASLEADCIDHLAALGELPVVTGVRRLLQAESSGFALQPSFLAGVRLLERFDFSMDLCVRAHQLGEVAELARRCAGVRFVLDHVGKPPIVADEFDSWAADLRVLAELPNVWCKLSGLASEAAPGLRSPVAIRPWLAHAIAVFGPDRCMFGSDWPVVTSVSSHRGWVAIVDAALDGDAAAGAAIFGDTARAVYGSRS